MPRMTEVNEVAALAVLTDPHPDRWSDVARITGQADLDQLESRERRPYYLAIPKELAHLVAPAAARCRADCYGCVMLDGRSWTEGMAAVMEWARATLPEELRERVLYVPG